MRLFQMAYFQFAIDRRQAWKYQVNEKKTLKGFSSFSRAQVFSIKSFWNKHTFEINIFEQHKADGKNINILGESWGFS